MTKAKTIYEALQPHLKTPASKNFTTKEKAAFYYGAVCVLAQIGQLDEALDLVAACGCKLPGQT